MKPWKKFLIPVDFSDLSRAAVHRGVDLAKRFDGSVTLLHVYHFPPYELSDNTVKEIKQAAQEAMDVLLRELVGATLSMSSRLEAGYPPEAIVGVAKAEGSDVIVMGTHGRTGLRHMLVGSVAERVIRHAPCPVLTIRDQH